MASLKIAKLEELVSKYIGKNKKIIDTKINRLTAPGENYGSTMLKVDLTLEDENATKEDLSVVAKLIPETEFFRNIFNIQVTFKNEKAYYDVVVPSLQDFQIKQGVKNVIDFFPRLYGGRNNLEYSNKKVDENAVIILENLKVQGYINVDRHQGFNLKTAQLIIKHLAQFHAVPLALKLLQPKTFEEKVKTYLACFNPLPPRPPVEENFPVIVDILKESVACVPAIHKIEQSLKLIKIYPKEFREPFSTIVHTDMWVNNIMVKFINGIPTRVKFIDFQSYSYDSPAKDLLFFLVTSVQTDVLKENLDDLIKLYHQEFIQTLVDLKCETSQFSYENFLEEFIVSIKPEFGSALFMTLFIVLGRKGGPTTSDDPTKPPSFGPKESVLLVAKERVWWAVQEFEKRGWLNF